MADHYANKDHFHLLIRKRKACAVLSLALIC